MFAQSQYIYWQGRTTTKKPKTKKAGVKSKPSTHPPSLSKMSDLVTGRRPISVISIVMFDYIEMLTRFHKKCESKKQLRWLMMIYTSETISILSGKNIYTSTENKRETDFLMTKKFEFIFTLYFS